MIKEFSEIYDKFMDVGSNAHTMDYVQKLPFTYNIDDDVVVLNSGLYSIKKSYINLLSYMEEKQFEIMPSDGIKYSHGENITNFIYKYKRCFEQFTVIADEIDVDCDDLRKEAQSLCNIAENLYVPYQEMINHSHDISKIISYINKTANFPDEQAVYIEMLTELNEEYAVKLPQGEELKNYDISEKLFNLAKSFVDIIDKTRDRLYENNFDKVATLSQKYVSKLNTVTGELSGFLVDKEFNAISKSSLKFTQNQKIQSYHLLADNSVILQKRGEFISVDKKSENEILFNELKESMLSFKFSKKPTIAKLFIKKIADDNWNFEKGLIAADTYLNNEQILKNMKMDFKTFETKSFEAIDDYMHSLINLHKLQQYAGSILSNKYKHLLSDNSLASFKILKDMGLTEHQLQDSIGKKLAAINSTGDFEKYLNTIISQYSGFSREAVSNKLEIHGIKPVYDQDNVLVFPVKKFEESSTLGSASWCIVRHESYFNTYTEGGNKQYFMYDFNKTEKDNESMIGFTLRSNGKSETQHAKNDDYHYIDEFLQNIMDTVIYRNKEQFKISQEYSDKLKEKFEKENTINKNKRVI